MSAGPPSTIDRLVRTKRAIVCVGPGGVGKTTTSAAIALRAAIQGRRTLVLTVDPAHRLANALGLFALDGDEQEISTSGMADGGAPLRAAMLSTQRTFDRLVQRYAPDPAVQERIFGSRFYEHAATRLAGSAEYMAMEKLHEILVEGSYDLLVLDTPPTAHALDFLSAPQRLIDFLGQDTDGLMARSTRRLGRLGLSILRAHALVVRGIGKLLGTELFAEILGFVRDFKSMYDGFKDRATHVKQAMSSEAVTFVVLTGPERASVDEGLFLREQLRAGGMHTGAFVVNRVRRPLGEVPDDELLLDLKARLMTSGALRHLVPERIAAAANHVAEQVTRYRTLVERDAMEVERLESSVGSDVPVLVVPDFREDIHDLPGLHRYGEELGGVPEEPGAL